MQPDTLDKPLQVATGYAFHLAGVPVFLPATVFMEYVAAIQAQPVPRAAARVVGLIQRRGTIVPVFDPQLHRYSRPLGKPLSVLVIGEGPQAGAILIEAQPQLVNVKMQDAGTGQALPGQHTCAFAAALSIPCRQESESGNAFWLLDPEALFHSLSKNGYTS
jgi:chemotaxis signal transduction protein